MVERNSTSTAISAFALNSATKRLFWVLVQLGAPIIFKAISISNTKVIAPVMREHVAIGTAAYTDEFNVYTHLKYQGCAHDTVRHRAGECANVSKDGTCVHTNTIEGFGLRFARPQSVRITTTVRNTFRSAATNWPSGATCARIHCGAGSMKP